MARQPQPTRITVHTKLYAIKDLHLLQEIWNLQSQKTYMEVFRNAFRLYLSLQRHEVSVLFELFPWLQNTPLNHTQLNYTEYLIERVKELEAGQRNR